MLLAERHSLNKTLLRLVLFALGVFGLCGLAAARAPGRHRLAGQNGDAPAMGDGLARSQGQETVAADKGVGRAGHRLDGHGLAPVILGQAVPGEDLQPVVTRTSPQPELAAAAG